MNGQSPAERFKERSSNIRVVDKLNQLDRFFLNQTTRLVRRDATFSLEGKLWEVSKHLRGQRVQIHYDPFTFGDVLVYHNGAFVEQARRLNKNLNANLISENYAKNIR